MVSNFIQQDCGVMFQHLVELCLALLNYVRKFDRQAELYKTVCKIRSALLNYVWNVWLIIMLVNFEIYDALVSEFVQLCKLCLERGFFELCSASGLGPLEMLLTNSPRMSKISHTFYNLF